MDSIRSKANLPEPGLHLVATPIGNLEDITLRALNILKNADVIACEDTRVTQKLLKAYEIKTPLMAYHDHNAAQMRPKILKKLKEGQVVALVSDAGTPLVSDPGYKLVRTAVADGVVVTTAPGASAVLAGLAVAGLPSDQFFFAGFLPPKTVARQKAIAAVKEVPGTLIFYETAPRLIASLQDLYEVLDDCHAVVARELTKKFEEVQRGRLSELINHYQEAGAPKGEIVILVAELDKEEKQRQYTDEQVQNMVAEAIQSRGMAVKEAAGFVAAKTGYKKRVLYQYGVSLLKKDK